jgi:hypothetical protein
MQTIKFIQQALGVMRMGKSAALAPVIGGILLAAGSSGLSAADVTFERLLNPEPHNWLMVHRDFTAQRHSALDQINKSNIKNMKLQFAVAIGGASPNESLQVTPLVDDGFMYVIDGWGVVYKIDVRSGNHGRILWKMDPGMKRYGRIRGVALWGNLVISPTGKDGRVIATDKETGKIVWDKNLSDHPELELSAAPLALKDDIIIGGPAAIRARANWIASLDPKTGDLKWKTYTIPAPGEPGSETWKDKNEAWKTGGGAFYVTGSYDPQTNLTIWGSGNPVPGYDATRRPGDNLFTASAIAFDVANGKMKWYFQYTPNDSRDYDETGTHVLIDTKSERRGPQDRHACGPQWIQLHLRPHHRPVSQRGPVCRQGHLDQGHRSEDRQARRLRPRQGFAVVCRAAPCPGKQGDAARVSRDFGRQQFVAGRVQSQNEAVLHSQSRRLRRRHAGPQRARAGQIRGRHVYAS